MMIDIPAVVFTDYDALLAGPPGGILFCVAHGSNDVCTMINKCPCGCGYVGSMPIGLNKPAGISSWEWNGSQDKATLRPSVDGRRCPGCAFHGYLTDGVWKSC